METGTIMRSDFVSDGFLRPHAVGAENVAEVFDRLFIQMLWNGMNNTLAETGGADTLLGPMGDSLFSQVLDTIARQQGLGFGRLLLRSAESTTRG
ncbi:MAG TPA: hypothetical protein ENJ79_06020 [Gammaproteobacteria bacterium]|nr:hypothetical protein [Gammaproteobacteria bacterium]